MKEIPILFSTAMVQAILEGRKSQTRRLVKDKHVLYSLDVNKVIPEYFKDGDGGWCPYGKPGDVLWVRETYMIEGSMSHGESVLGVKYKAGGRWIQNDSKEVFEIFHKSKEGWRPNIFLPKVAARIWLQVESVRVERLKDITDSDAIAEGIESKETKLGPSYIDYETGYCNGLFDARRCFQSLWQLINGAESWQANPWVWVVSFKVLFTTGKPAEKSAITNI